MRRIRVMGDNGLTRLVRMPSASGGRVFIYRLWIGPQPNDVLPLSPAQAAEWRRVNRIELQMRRSK